MPSEAAPMFEPNLEKYLNRFGQTRAAYLTWRLERTAHGLRRLVTRVAVSHGSLTIGK
jgi:hypothetical protein